MKKTHLNSECSPEMKLLVLLMIIAENTIFPAKGRMQTRLV